MRALSFTEMRLCRYKSQCELIFDEMMHCTAGIGWDNNILQFETHRKSRSGPLALILLLFGVLNPSDAWQRGNFAMIWTM